MAAAAAGYRGTWRRGSASRFLVFFTALAFVLQSFVAQTHFHAESPDSIVKIALSHGQGKTPADNSARDCPLCQAVVHAGALLTPAPPLLVPPLSSATVLQFVVSRAVASLSAHNWQSRAPPQR